jgi:hemolysin III
VSEATLDSGRRPDTTAQGRDEELVNSITHGLGLVLSVAGISALATLAANTGTTRYAFGCGVYGASLVMVYAASTLFHGWPAGEVKRFFLLLDHIGIYVLIVGTYTPLALLASRGLCGWLSLAAAWGFALIGSCAKVVRIARLDADSPVPYFVMCALCEILFRRPLALAPPGQAMLLIAGRLFYMAGLIFFLNDNKRFYHSIWHLFVLAGSICHYRAVLGYVIMASS